MAISEVVILLLCVGIMGEVIGAAATRLIRWVI
jgi:hypothetical protein